MGAFIPAFDTWRVSFPGGPRDESALSALESAIDKVKGGAEGSPVLTALLHRLNMRREVVMVGERKSKGFIV